jgi:pSer/pThr/pTyr-binding forkhead associated (FHA) protein
MLLKGVVALKRQPININGKLTLQIEDEKYPDVEPVVIKAPGVEGYVIGRHDDDNGYQPDVDLAPYHALGRGISRRHAALVRYRGQVHVIDLGSMNGTYINGERMIAHNAYALYANDRLSIANLDILVRQ